jgi:hypothetical protein
MFDVKKRNCFGQHLLQTAVASFRVMPGVYDFVGDCVFSCLFLMIKRLRREVDSNGVLDYQGLFHLIANLSHL